MEGDTKEVNRVEGSNLRRSGRWLLMAGLVLALVMLAGASVAAASSDAGTEECLSCHDQEGFTTERDGETLSLYVDGELLGDSSHGGLACETCHREPHSVAEDPGEACVTCHGDTADEFEDSIHGMIASYGGDSTCASCHDPHAVFPSDDSRSSVHRSNITETCASCHDGWVLESYEYSFHGSAVKLGSSEAATCVDCHGDHDILAQGDPQSSVHEDNLPETCASCHGSAQANFAVGAEHVTPRDREAALPQHIVWKFFIGMILFDTLMNGSLAMTTLTRRWQDIGKLSDKKAKVATTKEAGENREKD